MEITSFQEYGVIGGILIALFLLVRQLMVWMQGRIDSKDKALDQRHEQLIAMTQSVVDYVNESKAVNAELVTQVRALAEQIEQMGENVCQRLEKFESDKCPS